MADEPSEGTGNVVTSWYAYEDYEPTRPVGVRFPYNPAIRFHFRTRTELGLWNVITSVTQLIIQSSIDINY